MSDKKDSYSGIKGRIIIVLMNIFHRNVHRILTVSLKIKEDDSILDIGCGGGTLLSLLSKETNAKTYGIDYSMNMVAASKKRNSDDVEIGKIVVKNASVSELPFKDNCFDIVTAFETIHFWPSLEEDLIEIKRVLKPGAGIHIMNRKPKEGSRWYDFVKFKSPHECRSFLERAGYVDIVISTELKRKWIYASAVKPHNHQQ